MALHCSLPTMFLVVLMWQNTLHAAAALFTVDAPQSSYIVTLGGAVDLACHFPVKSPLRTDELMIIWLHSASSQGDQQEVYVLQKGEEDLSSQDTNFTGRVTLLKEMLYRGAAVLQITSVKLSDNGTYECRIGYGGADYKYIDLKVKAPYAKINSHAELAAGGDELVLTCNAEGFPMVDVYWQGNGANISVQLNTSHARTAHGLYNVTSTLRVRPKPEINYRCLFWNNELQETTSAELFTPAHRKAAVAESPLSLSYIFVPVGVALLVIVACAVVILKRKKSRSRNDTVTSAGIVIHLCPEEEECVSFTNIPHQNTALK